MTTIMNAKELPEKTEDIMKSLKNFQKKTAERCFELFTVEKQRRVLVADEVGLGKTHIAKGVIAMLATDRHREEGDNLFKVAYVCSNSAIIKQNIRKLIIPGEGERESSNMRMSMQHLENFQQKKPSRGEFCIQYIPLTPTTSFSHRSGPGERRERALICTILEKSLIFEKRKNSRLRSFLRQGAISSFEGAIKEMEGKVIECNTKSKDKYLRFMRDELKRKLREPENLNLVQSIKNEEKCSISKLRLLFARISVELLEPDLIIMDEFQRFPRLIDSEDNTEEGMLVKSFLSGKPKTNTLLLSATPYKLYQTLQETAESGEENHYKEFFRVMDFLFCDEEKSSRFKNIWKNYSDSLRSFSNSGVAKDLDSIVKLKHEAEKEMYSGICRTERLLVEKHNDETGNRSVDIDSDKDTPENIDKDTKKDILEITEADILSFVEAKNIIEDTRHIWVEHVKSCPYLLSFMDGYQYKDNVKNVTKAKRAFSPKMLFVDEKKINSFRLLPANNARLECLSKSAFKDEAEKLLWIPPSIPYYQPEDKLGPYYQHYQLESGSESEKKPQFTKTLVFSAWAMVPRMIACLLSYECERRTIGKQYGAKTGRVSHPRLTENRDKPLKTPSMTLADLYDPIKHLGKPINNIRKNLESSIRQMLEDIKNKYNIPTDGRADPSWYWIAAELFDGIIENDIPRRRMPDDILEVLTNMAIASPAVCALRVFNKYDKSRNSDNIGLAKKFAEAIVSMFNKPEAIAAIDLTYSKSTDYHYKNVLKYCVDGNFAAMLDEYAHVLNDKNPTSLCDQMCEALETTTASYIIDTFSSFNGNKKATIRMRSHFAAGFYQTRGSDEKTAQRKESLRTAFNSPFRPFILATTSIGQEGLDFHNYTRRIMHWNLPHNPIDIEQREGRINRYKCLAIRQSLAQEYDCKKIMEALAEESENFNGDVWDIVFDKLAGGDKNDGRSGLVPYWCLPGKGRGEIERVVPMYPYSKDEAVYRRLRKILSLYRITLGQTRQEELLDSLFDNCNDIKLGELKKLFIDLSPFSKKMQLEGAKV